MSPEVLVLLALLAVLGALGWVLAMSRGSLLTSLRRRLGVSRDEELLPAVASAVTARTSAERPVERADDVGQLADLIGVGIIRLDGELMVRFANRAAHAFLGRRSGGLLGLTAIEAFADHRIEEVVATARSVGAANGELTLHGGDEPTVLLRAQRSQLGGAWVVMEDVSELRRLQRIRAEFIDNLSHELRTPLTTVRLLTETVARDLERTDLPPRIRDGIQKIDVETGHLVQMVNELLDLSKIEQGATQLHLDAVDLAAVVRASLDRLRLFADRQGVTLRAELPDTLPLVRGDDERLGQLLMNLLHNAVKFSSAGAEVVVRARADAESVVVAVKDHGAGIPRADLDRVFERFYKVDKARVRGKGGTGLGLAIARHIVEGHDGRIWVESEEGSGSTFSFAIPTNRSA